MAGTSPERGLLTPAPANTHGPALILLPLLSWLPAEGLYQKSEKC